MNFKILFILLFLSTTSLIAKEKNWQIVLANGDTISEVSMQDIQGNFLICSNTHPEFVYLIPVDSITELQNKKKSEVKKFTLIGVLIGGATGALIGWHTYKELAPTGGMTFSWHLEPGSRAAVGGVLGAFTGLIIGRLIGVLGERNEVYDLSQSSYDVKAKFIQAQLK